MSSSVYYNEYDSEFEHDEIDQSEEQEEYLTYDEEMAAFEESDNYILEMAAFEESDNYILEAENS
jgi:hypothetical protein